LFGSALKGAATEGVGMLAGLGRRLAVSLG
jgi:hypothetical protein